MRSRLALALLCAPACFNPDDSNADTDLGSSSTSATTSAASTGSSAPTTSATTSSAGATGSSTDTTETSAQTSASSSDEGSTSSDAACGDGEIDTGLLCFDGLETVQLGAPSAYIAADDVNQDTFIDLVAVSAGTAELRVLEGDGSGAFSPGTAVPLSQPATFVALGNFDNANGLDYVVSNGDMVETGRDDGTGVIAFVPIQQGNIRAIAVGDLDMDGRDDLAMADDAETLLALASGGIDPFVPNPVNPGPGFSFAVAVADLDDDNRNDILVSRAPGMLQHCFGDGAGGVISCDDVPLSPEPSGLGVGDFNNDGNADVAVGDGMVGELTILLGNGSGGFTSTSKGMGALIRGLVVADFNADAFDDVAYITSQADVHIRLWNPDDDTLDRAQVFEGTGTLTSVAVADLNEDGAPDLALSNSADATVSLLLSNI